MSSGWDDPYDKLPQNFIKRIEFWDLARSGYIFTRLTDQDFHFDYSPMTPQRSSSGHYDGGPSISKKISSQDFITAENKWKEIKSNTNDQADDGYMGTLLLKEISNGQTSQFYVNGSSSSGKELLQVMKKWLNK